MKKTISLTLALLIALAPSTNIFAAQGAEENLQQIIESAKSTLDNGSLKELIKAIKNLSNGIVEYEQVKDLKSLKLQGELKKNTYYLGEKIDLSGVTLIARFSDGVNREIPLDNIKESDIYLESLMIPFEIIPYSEVTIPATYMLALKFGNFYATGSAYVTIEQKPISLESISIKSMPKTEYIQGEQLDITALVVEGTYSDGTKKIINNDSLNLTGFDTNKIGEQTLTIRFENKITTYTVNVKQAQELEPDDTYDDIRISRLLYTPKGSFEGEISFTLTSPTSKPLKAEDFSVRCPGLKDMTISSVSTDDNKSYKIKTPIYNDNNYILEIYLGDKTIEGSFLVKSNCPIVSFPYIVRESDDKAFFKFNLDGGGSLRYLIREVNKVARVNEGIPTLSDLKNGKLIGTDLGPNSVELEYDFKANTEYELFYVTTNGLDYSEVYGPVNISAKVEESSTSSIKIDRAEVQITQATQDVVITLSNATQEPLTLDDFEVICPANAPLTFHELVNGTGTYENRRYTLKMYGGFYDNNYELIVHFPDGTYTKGSFRCSLATPLLTGINVKRLSETSAKVSFISSLNGYIYYGVGEGKYGSDKIPYDELLATAPIEEIHVGKNTIMLENVPNDIDRYFQYITENLTGNKMAYVGGGEPSRIPAEISKEEPPSDKESKIKIENIELMDIYGEMGIKFTLSEDIGDLGLVNSTLTFEGEDGMLPERYMVVSSYPIGQHKTFFMDFRRYPLYKGTYTLTIEFDDGVAKKDITFTEDVNK